jgi:hypothetical protein
MVEPVFTQIKANRRIGRFKRRGPGLGLLGSRAD